MGSSAHQDAEAARVRPLPCGAAEVAKWYRSRLGWPVEVVDRGVHLLLTGGLVGFEVPGHQAGGVVERLTDFGAVGPALRIGERDGRVVFLCDVNDAVFAQSEMPVGTRYLRAPVSLPLPSPRPSQSWFVAPEPNRPWLPSAGAVLHAVRAAAAAAAGAMACRQVPVHRLEPVRRWRGSAG
ncbi:hypothetical protein Q5530_36950 [Saccharothrix sp. BKS2]|uniref:hypothetical protein n=1 Tax=Saccharothrix sp. BKS2 TaxID=3064400 RepID=UPI0039EC10B7